MPLRNEFVAAVKAMQGVPYLWGGDSPRGLDCSGLVCWCLYAIGGPDWRKSHWTDRFWLELPDTLQPEAGDLAFYGSKGDPSHVVVCMGGPHDAVIGANGGGRDTTNLEQAHAQRAFVKRKPSPNYRPDLLGFRSTAGWWR